MFQLTAARRRLVNHFGCKLYVHFVSTHSRPKAAGTGSCYVIKNGEFQLTAARRRLGLIEQHHQFPIIGFNSQPPEGGWMCLNNLDLLYYRFQLTAARRRLEL